MTEAALNCQTKLSPRCHMATKRATTLDDRAGRWRGRLGGNNGQIMLYYAQREPTAARARIRTRIARSVLPPHCVQINSASCWWLNNPAARRETYPLK